MAQSDQDPTQRSTVAAEEPRSQGDTEESRRPVRQAVPIADRPYEDGPGNAPQSGDLPDDPDGVADPDAARRVAEAVARARREREEAERGGR